MVRYGFVVWAACLVLVFGTSSARADFLEGGACVVGAECMEPPTCGEDATCILEVTGGAGGTCEPFAARRCCTEGGEECDGLDACRIFDRLTSAEGVVTGVCFPNPLGRNYCEETPERFAQCHTSPTGEIVTYPGGDCDGDNRPNSVDRFPCIPGPAWGIDVDGTCAAVPDCAGGGDVCETVDEEEGVCRMATPSPADGFACLPMEDSKDLLFCEGGELTCPPLTRSLGIGTGRYCVPTECPPAMDADCLTAEDGGPVVPWNEGDCDRDEDSNGEEVDEGSDPCTPSTPRPDAGMDDAGVNVDAGAGDAGPTPDAGSNADAGRPGGDASMAFDAGDARELNFEGGGGCACRATPAGPRSGGWLALGLVGLALARRRRLL